MARTHASSSRTRWESGCSRSLAFSTSKTMPRCSHSCKEPATRGSTRSRTVPSSRRTCSSASSWQQSFQSWYDAWVSAELVRKTFVLLLLIAIPIPLPFIVMSPQLVRLTDGGAFHASAAPLRVLAVAVVAMFATTISSNMLIALNRQRELIAAAFLSLVLNMGLNLYLMPRYSYMGAALPTVASESFAVALIYTMSRRAYGLRLGVRLVSRLAVPIFLAAAVVLLLSGFAVTPVAIAGVALGAFVVGVMVAGCYADRCSFGARTVARIRTDTMPSARRCFRIVIVERVYRLVTSSTVLS